MKPKYSLQGKATAQFYQSECLKIVRALAPNSIDAIITDPPYGLSEGFDLVQLLKDYSKGKDYKPSNPGFKGNIWDGSVPGPETLSEFYRVLKPGGFLAAFGAKNTTDLLKLGMRVAGFQPFDELMWIHCQGTTKKKAVQYEGRDMRIDLAPKYEPIVLVRKPISEKNFTENLATHRTGLTNAKTVLDNGYAGDIVIDGTEASLNAVRKLTGVAFCPVLTNECLERSLNYAKPGAKENRLWLDGCGLSEWSKVGSQTTSIVNQDPVAEKNFHPTKKPIALMAHLVKLLTLEGATILDPFCGSGPTAIASNLNNRNFIGIDMNGDYLKLAEHRTRLARERFKNPQDFDFDYFLRFVSSDIMNRLETNLLNEILQGVSTTESHRKYRLLFDSKLRLKEHKKVA